jgi:hypothetical protein
MTASVYNTRTVVEILDLSLNKVAEVRNLYPLNKAGVVLRYSKELSDFGTASFRVSTKDPLLTELGDILVPHKYHIRIKRGETIVWKGAIIDNPDRNKNYIEVTAAEYDFYFGKILIRRDAEVVSGDGRENYRTFSSGTMAAAVTTLVNDAKTDFGATHPLNSLVVSSANIENPNYPTGFSDANGIALTGGWTFTDFITLQFDYHTVLYVLKAFGIYASCDFEIDENLNFYFKPFIGNKQTDVTFRYGTQGNIVDYNSPRYGRRMVNDLWGIAADTNGKILHVEQKDIASEQTYGLLQGAEAFGDVKDQNFLKTRINESLNLTKTPDDSPVNILLDEKAYPLGQYDIGDIVTIQIKDHIIDFNQPRRIVGITANVHNTGREMVTVQSNKPKDSDVGA